MDIWKNIFVKIEQHRSSKIAAFNLLTTYFDGSAGLEFFKYSIIHDAKLFLGHTCPAEIRACPDL